jgi:hypothetical protein
VIVNVTDRRHQTSDVESSSTHGFIKDDYPNRTALGTSVGHLDLRTLDGGLRERVHTLLLDGVSPVLAARHQGGADPGRRRDRRALPRPARHRAGHGTAHFTGEQEPER